MYRFFDHTADLGLEVTAPDLGELFRDAAQGLVAMIVERPPRTGAGEPWIVHLENERDDFLLFDWLNELLFRFETRHELPAQIEVAVENGRLDARVLCAAVNAERDRPLREVKAITYHELSVRRCAAGWSARVIVDI
ncbi:MAG: archease [bacterium]|nr:archease [bacterium]